MEFVGALLDSASGLTQTKNENSRGDLTVDVILSVAVSATQHIGGLTQGESVFASLYNFGVASAIHVT